VGPRLRAALGAPAVIRQLPSSPRSHVWLVEFGGVPAVMKQIASGPGADGRFAREAAALRLAGRARPWVVPGLLAADPDTRVLVLEYLAEEGSADGWPTSYATALARLHAAAGPADAGALPAWSAPGPADARAFVELAAWLGVGVPPGLPGELDGLLARLDPAGEHALLHGDPCPGNTVYTSAGFRFLDLGGAAFGAGYTELAYLRTGFPTCWCAKSIPEPERGEAEAAYRATWRSLTGTDPAGRLADSCAGWLIRGDALVERAHRGQASYLAQLPGKDWRWGTATARQRLLDRLTVVATLGADAPGLAALVQVSRAMAGAIGERWPDIDPLPAAHGDPILES
jgi:hypothetical protein